MRVPLITHKHLQDRKKENQAEPKMRTDVVNVVDFLRQTCLCPLRRTQLVSLPRRRSVPRKQDDINPLLVDRPTTNVS